NSFMQHSVEKKLVQKLQEIKQLKEVYEQSVSFKFQSYTKEVEHIKVRFPHAIDSVVNIAQNQLLNLQKMLESNNPKNKSKSGFAQISKDKKVVDISQLNIDDCFELQSDEVYINAVVTAKESK
ncbi:MAG: exodeoxyribonuclease VII large subunit, partial [Campylobacterota bacterium]|nr:exodeoxyribonuclease VII large subunit [Campylobacterota bacterium]